MGRRGFSLIELMIVVGIILVVAAIATPNLIRSKVNANESAAVASLRALNAAEVTYVMTYNSGYPDTLNRLGPPTVGQEPSATAADLVDQVLAGETLQGSATKFEKNGYVFRYTTVGVFPEVNSYYITADPLVRGSSGQRSFFTNEPLIIRFNSSATATAADNSL